MMKIENVPSVCLTGTVILNKEHSVVLFSLL